MAARLNAPPRGVTWLHIDRLDRQDGKVWAVQYWVGEAACYVAVSCIICAVPVYSQFFGPKSKQPKACLVAERAKVTIRGAIAYIDAA